LTIMHTSTKWQASRTLHKRPEKKGLSNWTWAVLSPTSKPVRTPSRSPRKRKATTHKSQCPHRAAVATPLWAKYEGEAHIPKSEKLESSGTPENSERECRGEISSHLGARGVIRKVLKCRCPKWPRMSHLDICSPSYGQKKGRESNWQFDS
jgi:hypothetical protein